MTSSHGSGSHRAAEGLGAVRALLEDLREEWREKSRIDREREARERHEAIARAKNDERIEQTLAQLSQQLKDAQGRIARLEAGEAVPDTGVHPVTSGPIDVTEDRKRRGLITGLIVTLTALAGAVANWLRGD